MSSPHRVLFDSYGDESEAAIFSSPVRRNLFDSDDAIVQIQIERQPTEYHNLEGVCSNTKGSRKVRWLPRRRVEILNDSVGTQQGSPQSCGPTSVLYVMKKRGRNNVSEELVENLSRIDDGLKNPDDIVRVSRENDLTLVAREQIGRLNDSSIVSENCDETRAILSKFHEFLLTNGMFLVDVDAPGIGGHYIVVLGVSDNGVRFFDPYHGVEAEWEFYGKNGFCEALMGEEGDNQPTMMAFC